MHREVTDMAVCEKLEKCPFYQVATTVGPKFVTKALYPNMEAQAKKIIEQNKK